MLNIRNEVWPRSLINSFSCLHEINTLVKICFTKFLMIQNNTTFYISIPTVKHDNNVLPYLKHCPKSIRVRSFSGPYFPAFGFYSVNPCILPKCHKIRTRKTSNIDTVHTAKLSTMTNICTRTYICDIDLERVIMTLCAQTPSFFCFMIYLCLVNVPVMAPCLQIRK